MDTKSTFKYFAVAILVLFCNTLFAADNIQAYKIDSSSSSIVIDGTSTLHPIKITANDFEGVFDFTSKNGEFLVAGDVYVLIESMVSGKKGLDRNMYRMFESKKYPKVHCRVESMEFKAAKSDEPASALLKAILTIREISQPFETEVAVVPGQGGFIVSGSTVVNWKDFKLRPPTILGVIRMHDKVTVNFDILVKPGD